MHEKGSLNKKLLARKALLGNELNKSYLLKAPKSSDPKAFSFGVVDVWSELPGIERRKPGPLWVRSDLMSLRKTLSAILEK